MISLALIYNTVSAKQKKQIEMATSVKIQDIKKIQQSRKDTVYGYIRRQKSLKYERIPTGIIYICILFYGNFTDEFDPEWKGKTMDLSKNNKRVRYDPTGDFESIFCKKIIESGYHEWKFKVIKPGTEGPYMMMGLWRCSKDKEPPTTTYFTNGKNQGYGYSVANATLSQIDNGCTSTSNPYGVVIREGDIVEMIVDFDDLSLSWKVNGKSYGKSHDITKDKYRAAIFMCAGEGIVEIMD